MSGGVGPLQEVITQSLAHFDAQGIEKIWVSYDIDAVNPAFVPCTGTDVDGGPSTQHSARHHTCLDLKRLAAATTARLRWFGRETQLGSVQGCRCTMRCISRLRWRRTAG